MYAEAVVMGGKATANITPLEAINKVRDRVGVPPVSYTHLVFEKSRFEEKKYEEISQELGISINTVKYHIKLSLIHIYTYGKCHTDNRKNQKQNS